MEFGTSTSAGILIMTCKTSIFLVEASPTYFTNENACDDIAGSAKWALSEL